MKITLLIIVWSLLLGGCATNTNQSLTERGLINRWQVNEDLQGVYKTYQSYAQSDLEFYVPLGGGPQASSDYFPSVGEAEIWVRMVGNAFASVTYILLELEDGEDRTKVTCNAYNKAWLKKCGEFQSLYQSSP
jgi:hypothetical protein